MLFYKKYHFNTPYEKEEIRNILKKIKRSSETRTWEFKGNVGSDAFTLSPSFYKSHPYKFRPEIYGSIEEGKKIILELRISLSLKIIFYTALIFNSCIWIYLLWLGTAKTLLVGLPICVLITFCMLLVEFYQTGNRAIQILITKLKLQKI